MSSVISWSEAEECLNPSPQGTHAFSSNVVYALDYFSENTVIQPHKFLIDKLRNR